MNSKYQFYEVVEIDSNKLLLKEINGFEAAILGMAQNQDGIWSYAVTILEKEETWHVVEGDLRSTGKMMKREDFY